MRQVSQLEGSGYLVSAASVALLAVPAFKSASEDPVMLTALLAGAGLSICGMALRWRSHRMEQKQKQRGAD